MGANCSTGPDKLLEIIRQMSPYALVPLIAKPNAGMPQVENGTVCYHMSPEEFCAHTADFLEAGACILGGCCGTTPEFIWELSTSFPQGVCKTGKLSTVLAQHPGKKTEAVTSLRKTVFLKDAQISPRISIFTDLDDLLDLSFDYDVIHIDLAGAPVDNFGDKNKGLCFLLEEITNSVANPLVFSGETEDVRALVDKYYPGRTAFL